MTKTLDACDEQNWLELTAGYLPGMNEIKLAGPTYPKELALPGYLGFQSREEAAAWVLSALSRRASYYSIMGVGPDSIAGTMPRGTWILGPPRNPDATFAPWFTDEPKSTNYRIIIHHNPRSFDERKTYGFWGVVYRSEPPVVLGRKHLSPEQKKIGKAFLEKLRAGYHLGGQLAEQVIGETGHPFWYSEGRVPAKSKT